MSPNLVCWHTMPKKKAFGTDGLVGRDYGNSSISFLWPHAMCLIYIDDIHSLTQL